MSRRDYFLRSERLAFSHWRADDLPLALALWGDPRVTRYIGGPFSPDAIATRLDTEIRLMDTHGVQYWPIFLPAGEEHVGCAGLRPYGAEERVYEFGVHLRPAYWGRGLAGEAGRCVVRFAFETLGARRLFAGHHPCNTVSGRMLKALGFRFARLELYPPTGLRHPSYLLESETGEGIR